ncbi:CaiB/BaiF CoA-transferase family protein [Rhodovulum sp. FJ3]|uniref:CaiB/BaiF CoA transferase family protein n=1 Tax=Rhodovulum sp. FJ3 TaxID=3079053 RepID=UPI00293DD3FC|nr:CaiB/BaiF CoA-transferase family protein [Rhodovulum sp. FJ3]MDV4169825.1 CaiB/BaiF CoA-transferase family protein [Rhodovulum sp. FJ3]
MSDPNSTALGGIRVLDLSRILAGPTATQTLADLGAEVIKIERPGVGDDTRKWGPPFVLDADGAETTESAYYLCANRNKKSVAINFAVPEGQDLIRQMVRDADVLVENLKTGDMARYGLDYATLSQLNPRLIYCSITGFGQTGPNAHRAGYDFMIQGEAGIMSLTGSPDGPPTKVGVGIADVMCGMYAVTGILAALQARHKTGRGQHIDICLYDTQVSWLINQGVGYLTDGKVPPRRGNDHPTIVPYGTFPSADGDFILAVGNDGQYRRLVDLLGAPELADDPRFALNADRVRNRDVLVPILTDLTRAQPSAFWIKECETRGIPAGPINDLSQVFEGEQVAARGMKISLRHPLSGKDSVDLIGNPLKLSDTPVTYHSAPPVLAQDTAETLKSILNLNDTDLGQLAKDGIIGLNE